MPAPKMPEYPKAMFKHDIGPVYARNEKDEDRLANEGWSATYTYREYPKMLYWPNERKRQTVQSQIEEKVALDAGWVTQPSAIHYGEDDPKIPNAPLPTAVPGSLADQFAKLQEMALKQQELINTLLLEKSESDDTPRRRRA